VLCTCYVSLRLAPQFPAFYWLNLLPYKVAKLNKCHPNCCIVTRAEQYSFCMYIHCRMSEASYSINSTIFSVWETFALWKFYLWSTNYLKFPKVQSFLTLRILYSYLFKTSRPSSVIKFMMIESRLHNVILYICTTDNLQLVNHATAVLCGKYKWSTRDDICWTGKKESLFRWHLLESHLAR